MHPFTMHSIFINKTPAHIAFLVLGCFQPLSQAYGSEVLVLRKEIIFSNWSLDNPLFETKKESVSCAKDFYYGNHNVPIRPGKATTRPYYENWADDACAAAPKRVTWIMTATRKADRLDVQCRISFIADIVDEGWSTQVKVEPYRSQGDDLCASNTLVRSAKCLTRPDGDRSRHRFDCLNKFAPGRANEIEVTLGGPDLGTTRTEHTSPFDSISDSAAQ